MAFKFASDSGRDIPLIYCDICGKHVGDLYSDQVSGTRGTFEAPGTLVFHHKACKTSEPLHSTIAEFFGMFLTRVGLGDRATDGRTDKVTLGVPTGKGFTT